MAAQKKIAEEASGLPAPPAPELIDYSTGDVAVTAKLQKLVSLNAEAHLPDKWAEANAYNAERVKSEHQAKIDGWLSAIDEVASRNGMSVNPYRGSSSPYDEF